MNNLLLEMVKATSIEYGTDIECSNSKIVSMAGHLTTYFKYHDRCFNVALTTYSHPELLYEYEFSILDKDKIYNGIPYAQKLSLYKGEAKDKDLSMSSLYGIIFWLLFEIINTKSVNPPFIQFTGQEAKLDSMYSKLIKYKNFLKIFEDNGFVYDGEKYLEGYTYPFYIFNQKEAIKESTMNIFDKLLKEALSDATFESTDEFVKAVKQVLRQSDIPRHVTKASKDKGFQETSRFGYSYSFLNGNITISFFGVDKHDINTLARDLSAKDINYKYNDKTVQFLIKTDDNVKSDALLSDEAKSELENNIYDVLGTSVKEKSKIKNTIAEFNHTQNKIYQELLKFELVQWKYIKGDNGRFAYVLLPKED